ncbi:MAG: glycosyltransferase family A protein [Pyrinomonadaceae bacterium]
MGISMETDFKGGTRSSSPAVSVVVPSYNHAPFVERCLTSIIKQTYTPFELIVIDDGSTDSSPRIIERTLKSCPFPSELIVRPNKGLCATLNEALARSRGKYFAYLSSDDAWLPKFLQARVNLLESQPDAVLAYGHAYIIDEKDHIVECSLDWAPYTKGSASKRLLHAIGPLSPTVLYRRKALERHGWNEGAKLEDYELYLRLSADGDFAFDANVLAAWRQHWYNTSRDFTMMMNEWLDAQRRVRASLGMSDEELAKIQTALKFSCAEGFARRGQKLTALALMSHNLKGAPSVASIARMAIRLTLPQRLMRWRRNLLQHQSSRHYGSLQT